MFFAISIPSTLIFMSISIPELKTFNLGARQQECKRLVGVGMVHYISTLGLDRIDRRWRRIRVRFLLVNGRTQQESEA